MDLTFQDRLLLSIASVSLLTCFFYLYYQICKKEEDKRLAEERERLKTLEGMGGIEDIFKLLIFIPIFFTRLGYLAEGMIHLIMGAAYEAMAAVETLIFIAEDVISFWTEVFPQSINDTITFITGYLVPYINCYSTRFDKILSYCWFFYLIDTFMQLLYLPFRAFFWALKTFLKIDMNVLLVDPFWRVMKVVDSYINKYCKFHIINENNFNFPMTDDGVINVCYICPGTKTLGQLGLSDRPYMEWILQVVKHWFRDIPNVQKKPVKELSTGGKSLMKVFTG